MITARIFRAVRLKLRLSQAALALRFDMSRDLIAAIESSRSPITDTVESKLKALMIGGPPKPWTPAELAEAQEQLGMSGAAIALSIGISRQSWSLWRRGKCQPRQKSDALRKLEALLNQVCA